MAHDDSGLAATLGNAEKNTYGDHAGIRIANGTLPDAPNEGSSGNPGVELPWEGADATKIGAGTKLPPLESL